MAIVADTSPINYLVLIDQIGILPGCTRCSHPTPLNWWVRGDQIPWNAALQQLSKFQKLSLNLDP